jgi:oligoribonuclease
MTQMELPYPDLPARLHRRPTLAWVDIETTGLEPSKDLILEVGIVVTDDDLEMIDQQFFVVKQHLSVESIHRQTNAFVQDLHARSGLWKDLENAKHGYEEVENLMLDFLHRHALDGAVSPMAGSSVAFDRAFLDRQMPSLAQQFHYRNLDVSAVKEWLMRVHPAAVASKPDPFAHHRTLADLHDSIAELRHYTTYVKENS